MTSDESAPVTGLSFTYDNPVTQLADSFSAENCSKLAKLAEREKSPQVPEFRLFVEFRGENDGVFPS